MKPYIFLLLTMALLTFMATASCYGEDGTAGNVTVDSTASLEVKNERPRLENHLNRSYYLDNYSELLSEALAKNRAIRNTLYSKYRKTGDKRYYRPTLMQGTPSGSSQTSRVKGPSGLMRRYLKSRPSRQTTPTSHTASLHQTVTRPSYSGTVHPTTGTSPQTTNQACRSHTIRTRAGTFIR
ncbi:hypothetical protein U2150_07725 [Methanothermobacter wolfeii]|uniref:Uncharacterized protein n=1 Tax=Methanothermobacter wolfeii TaxID=145261 RepID=A0ABU8TWD3_METWO